MSGTRTSPAWCAPRGGRAATRTGFVTDVDHLHALPEGEREQLRRVSARFDFRVSEYYLDLIDWTDPADPLRALIIPHPDELSEFGALDASNEASNVVAPGVQHKYADTALVLCVDACGGYCRYCFRKRLFMRDTGEVARDLGPALDYIAEHAEITDVLLTGGDPLLLPTERLVGIISALREMPHVRTVRIGTKMLAFDPFRVLDDPRLVDLLSEESGPGGRVYVMTHFDHPRELTDPAIEAVDRLVRHGIICANQCPIAAGINDDAAVLRELFEVTTAAGCPQYYLFQGRPTYGNAPFRVPIVRGWELFSRARVHVSGLGRRARFCMSHESGKIEVVGVDERHIFARYHRARDAVDHDRMLVCERDDSAVWLDDLVVCA